MNGSKFLVGLLILVSWSCQNHILEIEPSTSEVPQPKARVQEGIIEVNKNEFLMIQIVPSTITSNSTNKFVVVNHTEYELFWNTIFTLEYSEKDNWQTVPVKGDWIDVGYVLYPNEIFSNEIITGGMTLNSLVSSFNNGKKGKYRITGNFTIPDVGKYVLSAEFEVI